MECLTGQQNHIRHSAVSASDVWRLSSKAGRGMGVKKLFLRAFTLGMRALLVAVDKAECLLTEPLATCTNGSIMKPKGCLWWT